jgi:hypothetical protein
MYSSLMATVLGSGGARESSTLARAAPRRNVRASAVTFGVHRG